MELNKLIENLGSMSIEEKRAEFMKLNYQEICEVMQSDYYFGFDESDGEEEKMLSECYSEILMKSLPDHSEKDDSQAIPLNERYKQIRDQRLKEGWDEYTDDDFINEFYPL